MELAVAAAQGPVSDRQPIRKHRSGALEKPERRERLKIGGIAVEAAIVSVLGHQAFARIEDWQRARDPLARQPGLGSEPSGPRGVVILISVRDSYQRPKRNAALSQLRTTEI